MENHNLDLTPKEQKVLEALIDELYAEAGFSDVDANDLARITGIPTKNIRGVLSSLVKKGIISLNETDNAWADKQYVIIYLNQDYWYLHPAWKLVIASGDGIFYAQDSGHLIINKDDYWQRRCKAAELYIDKSPCGPDVYTDQFDAYCDWRRIVDEQKLN
jgi:hypothetical protein